MSDAPQEEDFFFPPEPAAADDSLTLNIDGWEGPLDLLLALARNQKVDLREISILELVQEYLKYIASAQTLRLELAADYLVMAAWLTYLKSGLLLPRDPEIDPSPEELALRLQMRLERLNAMRNRARGCWPGTGSGGTSSCVAHRKVCGWSRTGNGRRNIMT